VKKNFRRILLFLAGTQRSHSHIRSKISIIWCAHRGTWFQTSTKQRHRAKAWERSSWPCCSAYM